MFLVGQCKKCGVTIKLDVGVQRDKEIIAKKLKDDHWTGFQCPGNHVELGPPYPHFWNVTDASWMFEEGQSESEEEFVEKLRKEWVEVVDTAGMTEKGIITGFAYGLPMTSDGESWDFIQSPKGKRWYYRITGDKKEVIK